MSAEPESPIHSAMRRVAEVPLDDLRDYVASLPSKESFCRTCGHRIRTTPSVHADGSVHWASGGWEHTTTESSGCEWGTHPYGSAQPPEGFK
jgi:hypothetical protein